MRSKQYFTSIKNNPHEISTDPIYCLAHTTGGYKIRKEQRNEKVSLQ